MTSSYRDVFDGAKINWGDRLYLLQFNHATKVGITKNIKTRIQQHKRSVANHGLDSEIKNMFVLPHCQNARVIESMCVARFGKGKNEWLDSNFEDIRDFIISCGVKFQTIDEWVCQEKKSDSLYRFFEDNFFGKRTRVDDSFFYRQAGLI